MDPGTDRVGVVGLGAMGRPMTEQLLRRPDTPVAIHGRGRDPYADLLDAGARWHDTACSLAAESSVVLLMLPDLPQVEEVLAGDDGLLAAACGRSEVYRSCRRADELFADSLPAHLLKGGSRPGWSGLRSHHKTTTTRAGLLDGGLCLGDDARTASTGRRALELPP